MGRIPLQVIDGIKGFLTATEKEAAGRISYLLRNPEKARKIGRRGIEHIRSNFWMTEHRDYLSLFIRLMQTETDVGAAAEI